MLQIKLPIGIAVSMVAAKWTRRFVAIRTCSSRAFIGILKHADNGSEVSICIMAEGVKSTVVCVAAKCWALAQ